MVIKKQNKIRSNHLKQTNSEDADLINFLISKHQRSLVLESLWETFSESMQSSHNYSS